MSVETEGNAPLEVGQFYDLITTHLEAAFGRRRPVWVRGEIAKIYEKGHAYIDLVDAQSKNDTKRPTLFAHCWQSQWATLRRGLLEKGVTLTEGAVVEFYGYVDLYAPNGRIGFTVTDINPQELVGELARRRQELLATLRSEGLLRANAERDLSLVPLRVGLVASVDTEGYNDFVGQLRTSGYSFDVTLVRSAVQGAEAPAQLVRGLETLASRDLDVICLVRGGGSRGDLICFDDETLARAIAACRLPVLTGIGHTGDESVADLVAYDHAITPTKLGEFLVTRVDQWYRAHVGGALEALRRGTDDLLAEATAYLGERRRTVGFAVRDRLRAERRHLEAARRRLALGARRCRSDATRYLATQRQLLSAYDPARRLAQGWALVSDATGRMVHGRADVAPGEVLRIRVSDGTIVSRVEEIEE